jgi:hypothetical protein
MEAARREGLGEDVTLAEMKEWAALSEAEQAAILVLLDADEDDDADITPRDIEELLSLDADPGAQDEVSRILADDPDEASASETKR